MKIKITIVLLLVAACWAAEERQRQKKKEIDNNDKRELQEGNAGLEKRASAIGSTVSPTTLGVEYADDRELQDKSNTQVYATSSPLPSGLVKISDVLAGQVPFPTAIASQLYSPVSVYQQPKFSSQPTYVVSQPIPSQLAYSEHKVSYQPHQNAIPQYNQKQQKQPAFARLTLNYQPPFLPTSQQIYIQQPPILYAQQQPKNIQPHQFFQTQPQNPQFVQFSPQVYQQSPLTFTQGQFQPPYQNPQVAFTHSQSAYNQERSSPPSVEISPPLHSVQPGVTFERQLEAKSAQNEVKVASTVRPKETEKQTAQPVEQINQGSNEGAVSYASFSIGQQATSYNQPQQYQPQPTQQQYPLQQQQYQIQQQQQYQPPQQQYQPQSSSQPQQTEKVRQTIIQQSSPQPQKITQQVFQPPQYEPQPQEQVFQTLPQPQEQVFQTLPQPQEQVFQTLPQPQEQVFQTLPQPAIQPQPQIYQGPPANVIPITPKPFIPGRQVFFRSGPVFPQSFGPGQQFLVPNGAYPQAAAVAPTFAPIQYFGKFAHELFGGYQQ